MTGIPSKMTHSLEINFVSAPHQPGQHSRRKLNSREKPTLTTKLNIQSTPHPSRLITQYLLQKVPTANLAIAHHNDWKVLMEEGGDSLLNPNELERRLGFYFDIELDSELNVVFLRRNDRINGLYTAMTRTSTMRSGDLFEDHLFNSPEPIFHTDGPHGGNRARLESAWLREPEIGGDVSMGNNDDDSVESDEAPISEDIDEGI
ncbi:hypothetical protein BDQ17DRAFT_1438419 [Cyathus striatus]|nr:hypothetical protein BDQ17DRAFT_1438419 [Cyathus striatus]